MLYAFYVSIPNAKLKAIEQIIIEKKNQKKSELRKE